MEDQEDDERSFELDQTTILEQQLQAYILSVLHQQTPRDEKVQNFHRMAVLLEQEEANYQRAGNLLDDERDDHPIGALLSRYSQSEELLIELLNIIMHSEDQELLVAVCRLVLASQAARDVAHITSTEEEEEELIEKLCKWVINEDTHPVLRAFAMGLLQKHIDGTDYAGSVASTDVPTVIVNRLSLAAQLIAQKSKAEFQAKLEAEGKQLFIRVPNVSPDSDALKPPLEALHITNDLFRYRELVYSLGCLAAIGEYIDSLAPVLQLGGMDVIFFFLKHREELHFLYGALALLTKLMAHQKFASVFVDRGGVEALVALPRGTSPNLLPLASLTSVAFLTLVSYPIVVEQICLLPEQSLSQLVEYTLWLLKCPDESARKNTSVFWTMCAQYRTLLDLFEQQHGLKTIVSELKSQLEPVQPPEENEEDSPPPPNYSKVVVFHMALALRNYFQMHLILAAQPIIAAKKIVGGQPSTPTPRYKALTLDDEIVDESVAQLIGSDTVPAAIATFLEMGGTQLVVDILDRTLDGLTVATSQDTVRCLVDLLRVLAVFRQGLDKVLHTTVEVSPETSVEEGEEQEARPSVHKNALSLVLEILKYTGPELPNILAIVSALKLISNYVCYAGAPPEAASATAPSTPNATKRPQQDGKPPAPPSRGANRATKALDELFKQAVKTIRSENSISAIISILKSNFQSPGGGTLGSNIDSANEAKAMACKVLLGLTKDPNIKQMLNKKLSRWLPDLLRDPTAVITATTNKKSWDHFKHLTLELMGVLTGRDAAQLALKESIVADPAMTQIERDAIVSSTPINYSSSELLELIAKHLHSKGLYRAATVLVEEARLAPDTLPTAMLFGNTAIAAPHPVLATAGTPTPGDVALRNSLAGPTHGLLSPPPSGPRRKRQSVGGIASKAIHTPTIVPVPGVAAQPAAGPKHEDITLDTIIHQFFLDQHRNCAKPISVVPEFSLKHRHQCPIPATYERPLLPTNAPTNAARRVFDRQIGASYNFNNTKAHWRRFKYSRYKPLRQTYGDEESALSQVLFRGNDRLLVGTYDSVLIQFNVGTGEVESSHELNEAGGRTLLRLHRNNNLLLSFSGEGPGVSLWDMTKMTQPQNNFQQPIIAGFNTFGDRIAGTTENCRVQIFDTETFKLLTTLMDATIASEGRKISMAQWSPDDTLVLNDAILWDVRAKGTIHRFDKFTDDGYEKFTPTGTEIIINSEIWDVRTFKLVKTCPALDSTFFHFNNAGDVILAGLRKFENDQVIHSNKFRAIDASTYELISELSLDRTISDLAIDPTDSHVVLLEQSDAGMFGAPDESFARIWEIGRVKAADDEDDEDEDEDLEEDDQVLEEDEDDEDDALLEFGDDGVEGDGDDPDADGDGEELDHLDGMDGMDGMDDEDDEDGDDEDDEDLQNISWSE